MRKDRLQWIVVPAGLSDDKKKLKFSILAFPRLYGDESGKKKLSAYPTFVSWTKTLKNVSFKLEAKFGSLASPSIILDPNQNSLTAALALLNDQLWEALFDAETVVSNFPDDLFSRDQKEVIPEYVKYEAKAAANYVGGLYGSFTAFHPGASDEERRTQLRNHIDQIKRDYADLNNPARTVVDTLARTLKTLSGPDDEPNNEKELDFHSMMHGLTEFPELARALGLVMEIEFESSASIPADTHGFVRLKPTHKAVIAENDFAPWTAFDIVHGATFTNVSATSDPGRTGLSSRGLLKLGREYSIQNLDLESAAHKISVVSSGSHQSTEEGLPALSTIGVCLMHSNANEAVESIRSIGRANYEKVKADDANGIILYEQDLRKGIEPEVEQDSKWLSLCARKVSLKIEKDGTPFPLNIDLDQGVVKHALRDCEPTTPGSTAVHVPESVFIWEGRSLGAPGPEKPNDGEKHSKSPFPETVTFEATISPRKQAKLRFGQTSKCRVQIINIAGKRHSSTLYNPPHGVDGDEIDISKMQRFDPVCSPNVSKSGNSSNSSEMRLIVDSALGRYPSSTSCKIYPPRVRQNLYEWHGEFDTYNNATAIWTHVQNCIAKNPFLDNSSRSAYFCDPLAKGILLSGIPEGKETEEVKFKSGLSGITLELESSQTAKPPKIIGGNFPSIKIYLQPGRIAKLRLRSLLDKNFIKENMGIWQEIEKAASTLPPGQQARLLNDSFDLIVDGKDSRFSPSTYITIVNAVPTPIQKPRFSNFQHKSETANKDGIFQVSGNVANIDVPSTAKVSIESAWTDVEIDTNENTGFKLIYKSGPMKVRRAGRTEWENDLHIEEKDSSEIAVELSQKFADTKFRLLSAKALAATSQAEYFSAGDVKPAISDPIQQFVALNSAKPTGLKITGYKTLLSHERQRSFDTVKQTSEGTRIRVYFYPSLFSSGMSEKIAVISPTEKIENYDPKHQPFISIAGSDPAWEQNESISSFSIKNCPTVDVSVSEICEPASPKTVKLYLLEPIFDKERKQFYVDLEFDFIATKPMHNPMVKLALASFQENSIDNCKLSSVAVTAFKQLCPKRTVFINHLGSGEFTVEVVGESYKGFHSEAGVKHETSDMKVNLEIFKDGWRPMKLNGADNQELDFILEPQQGVFKWTHRQPFSVNVLDLSPHRIVIREEQYFGGDTKRTTLVEDIDLPFWILN